MKAVERCTMNGKQTLEMRGRNGQGKRTKKREKKNE